MAKSIIKVLIKHIPDNDPDTSWIGTFSSVAGPGAIDHRERSGEGHRVLQYFNPANPEYGEAEYEHMMRLERGESAFIGVKAEAVIVMGPRAAEGYGKLETITSDGLWGIETDSSAEYLQEIGQEQLAGLADYLRELGFPEAEVQDKIASAERE
jgi:hypothetical protein